MPKKKSGHRLLTLVTAMALFVSACDTAKGKSTPTGTGSDKTVAGSTPGMNHATVREDIRQELAAFTSQMGKEAEAIRSNQTIQNFLMTQTAFLPGSSEEGGVDVSSFISVMLDSDFGKAFFDEKNVLAKTDSSITYDFGVSLCPQVDQSPDFLKTCTQLLSALKLQLHVAQPSAKTFSLTFQSAQATTQKLFTTTFSANSWSQTFYVSNMKQVVSLVTPLLPAELPLVAHLSNIKELSGVFRYDMHVGSSAAKECLSGDTVCVRTFIDEPFAVATQGSTPMSAHIAASFPGTPGFYLGNHAGGVRIEFASNTVSFDLGQSGKGEFAKIVGQASLPHDNSGVATISNFSLGDKPASFMNGPASLSIDLNKSNAHTLQTFRVWLDVVNHVHEVVLEFSPMQLVVNLQDSTNPQCNVKESIGLTIDPKGDDKVARLHFPIERFLSENGTPPLPSSGKTLTSPTAPDGYTGVCDFQSLMVAGFLPMLVAPDSCSDVDGLIVETGSASIRYGFTLADQSGTETLTADAGQCLALMM